MPLFKKNLRSYIAMWDHTGLECIFDCTEEKEKYVQWEKDAMVSILKGDAKPTRETNIPIQQMILRARFNSQREYEIYEFNSTVSIKSLEKAFQSNPQPIVEFIRDNGYKIYSDYNPDKKFIV